MELTKFGLWIGRSVAEEQFGEAAQLAEELGYGALWVGGSRRLPALRPMLEASERIVIASGIVNIWAYDDPGELAEEFAALDADFPGRLLLGIGIGHPEATQQYEKPLTKTQGFLDGIAGSAHPVPRERMALAALGPKMLDLSFERTLGTHPYFTTPAHTAFARERLGAAALIAPEQAVVIDHGDAGRAHETARGFAGYYLGLTNYTGNLKRFGYTDADFADGGSKRVIDDVVPQGPVAQVAAAVHAQLEAGADHVCVQTIQPSGTTGVPAEDWRALAAELIG
jgi:probable F420-dependent oxidoreductase